MSFPLGPVSRSYAGARRASLAGVNTAVAGKVMRGSASVLGCLLGAALIVVAVPAPHAAEPVTISYAGDLARLARLAPYPAVAPAGLPASWQPVSSGLAVGGANGAGTVTWQLGFMTPDGALAALAESNASAAAFVRRMTNDGIALARGPTGRADLAAQLDPGPRPAVHVPDQRSRVHAGGYRQRDAGPQLRELAARSARSPAELADPG